MFPIRRVPFLCLLAWVIAAAPLAGADRVFVLPSSGSTLVTVLDAADLSLEASIPANFTSFKILGSPGGDKYFILTRNAAEAVIVVDADTLQVLRRVALANGVSDGDLSPNGQDLLLVADKLRVVRLGTEEQVIAEVDMGGGADQIVVNAVANQAFILANGGRLINVVDLATYEVTNTITVSGVRSIALSASEDRLVAAKEDRLLQFRTSDQVEIPAIPTEYEIRSGAELFAVGNSARMLLRNNGSAPRNTSQLFDLDARTVKAIGTAGSTGLREVLIVSESRAFTVVESTQELAEINFDALPNASVTPLSLEISALNLAASPNLKRVYVSSSIDSSMTIIDAETRAILAQTTTPVPARDHAVLFGPSTKPPTEIAINSGNTQYIPPGTTTPSPLSVTVTDEDGTPLFGVPVLFTPSEDLGLQFKPSEVVTTNTRGIASVLVSVPADEAAVNGPPGTAISTEAAQAEGESAATGAAPAIQRITITATTPSGPSTGFTLNVIRTTGIIKISGDYQVTEERTGFPEPFVVLATDETGRPLSPGTNMLFAAGGATCLDIVAPKYRSGFASMTCTGDPLIPGAGTSLDGSVTVSVQNSSHLGTATFTFTVASDTRSIRLEKVAGDNQKAPTGTKLPTPLTFEVKTGGTPLGTNGVGVQIRQKSGPAVSIDPIFAVARQNFVVPVDVTLGSRAGKIVIEAVASSPGKPKTEFTIEATGGLFVRLEKSGDGQAARIGRFLAQPLRVRVFNESALKVPFPAVQWKVVSGSATLLTATDSDGATARVQFGLTPGPVVVQASIEGLTATFNLTAVPPQTIAVQQVSGDGQTIQVGKKSEPMIVQVVEVGDLPALGAVVTFSGPSNLLFHPAKEGETEPQPANPLQLIADVNGRAGVIVELLGILPPEEGVPAAQAAAVQFTATAGAFSTLFALTPLGRTPVFETSSVANGATFIPGIVPGSIASIFGEGLSEGVTGTAMAAGALTFRGLTVKVGGIAAPILTVTRAEGEQVNVQVPFQIPTGQTTTVEVDNNGSIFSVTGVPVFSSQPGIFLVDGPAQTTLGAIVHPADFSLVTPQKPAEKGKSVALFFTGGGLLNPAVATGVPGPVPAALMALPLTVKVDGKNAEIGFSGYAPGLLGVYQINFAIPTTSECGARSLNLSVAGADSPAISIAVKCE